MLKLISISPDDRKLARVLSREPDEATAELTACTSAVTDGLGHLARAYPNCCGFATFIKGEGGGAVVLTASREFLHCSAVSLNRVITLANIIAALPPEMLSAFQVQLNLLLEKQRLEAEMEKAVSAALAAAAEKRSE